MHGLIPSHWLPMIAIGKKYNWSHNRLMRFTFQAALAHAVSTVLIGLVLAFLGKEINKQLEIFTTPVASGILILVGIWFVFRHFHHHHFHLSKIEEKSPRKVLVAVILAMFFSPCLEIESNFLLIGTYGWQWVLLLAAMYTLITLLGMLFWVSMAYRGLQMVNSHKWEHNAGIITGIVLILTGLTMYWVH